MKKGTNVLKEGFTKMTKEDVVNAKQASIAEDVGTVTVVALKKIPAYIRAAGGVVRIVNPTIIKEVVNAISISIMTKARIGHIAEAQILETLGVDLINESEVITPTNASLMIQLGFESIFASSENFKPNNPHAFTEAIVKATHNYDKPEKFKRSWKSNKKNRNFAIN